MTTVIHNTDIVILGAELARLEAQAPEWDDAKAAEGYRLDQARDLIRSVRVAYTLESHVASCVGYVHQPIVKQTEPGYVAVGRVKEQPDAVEAALAAEIGRVRAAVTRARELAAVFGKQAELEAALRELIGT